MNSNELLKSITPWIDIHSKDYFFVERNYGWKPHTIDSEIMGEISRMYKWALEPKGPFRLTGIILRKLRFAERKSIQMYLYYDAIHHKLIDGDKEMYFPMNRLIFEPSRYADIYGYIEIQSEPSYDGYRWINLGYYMHDDLFGVYVPRVFIFKRGEVVPEEQNGKELMIKMEFSIYEFTNILRQWQHHMIKGIHDQVMKYCKNNSDKIEEWQYIPYNT